MKEDQTLADFFTLTEKHALWDEARCANKTPEQPRKESTIAQKKKYEKQYNKSRQEAKQDMSKLDHTKYYAFHRGPDQTNDDCYTWKNYLKKLMKEGKVDKYLDKPIVQPRRNADANKKPLAKTIWINGIFIEFEHLGATNNSKKRNIQQALLTDQENGVQNPPPADETGWKPEEDAEHIILDPQQPKKTARISSRLSLKENGNSRLSLGKM
ncbi:hypothetical protein ACFX10_003020 [Malus domestica]